MAQPRDLIVDGNNLMGSRPDGWWKDRAAAKRRLADELTGRPLTLVFDGHPIDGIDAVFSGDRSADDVIVELLASHPGATVVTSDRELQERVLEAGGNAIGVRHFLGR